MNIYIIHYTIYICNNICVILSEFTSKYYLYILPPKLVRQDLVIASNLQKETYSMLDISLLYSPVIDLAILLFHEAELFDFFLDVLTFRDR